MTRDELLATLRAERAHWEALLATIGDERMTEPGAEDAWSVCDIVAHITTYERWLVDQLSSVPGNRSSRSEGAAAPAEPPATGQRSSSRRGAQSRLQWQAHPPHSLRAVREEAAREFARLVELVAALPDEVLAERWCYEWTARQPLWRAIASDSYEHYAQHAASIRVWLAGCAA